MGKGGATNLKVGGGLLHWKGGGGLYTVKTLKIEKVGVPDPNPPLPMVAPLMCMGTFSIFIYNVLTWTTKITLESSTKKHKRDF